jgi:hypothetical protein
MSLTLSNKPNFYERNYTPLIADTRKNGSDWFGTVVRMDQGRKVKKIPEGSRRRGRPRMRWLEDVEKYLREMEIKI